MSNLGRLTDSIDAKSQTEKVIKGIQNPNLPVIALRTEQPRNQENGKYYSCNDYESNTGVNESLAVVFCQILRRIGVESRVGGHCGSQVWAHAVSICGGSQLRLRFFAFCFLFHEWLLQIPDGWRWAMRLCLWVDYADKSSLRRPLSGNKVSVLRTRVTESGFGPLEGRVKSYAPRNMIGVTSAIP